MKLVTVSKIGLILLPFVCAVFSRAVVNSIAL